MGCPTDHFGQRTAYMILSVFDCEILSDYVLVLVQSLVTLAATKYRLKCTQRLWCGICEQFGSRIPDL